MKLIELARLRVGDRSRVNRVNIYGDAVGENGMPWAGSFLEVVFTQAGVQGEPRLVTTASALREYVTANRLYQRPRVGDIAFFGFSTDNRYGQPHVGLVTETGAFRSNGVFLSVEGQTEAGPGQEANGVHERMRYGTEVIGFARPRYDTEKAVSQDETTAPITVRVAHIQPGHKNRAVEAVQLALSATVQSRGMRKGTFDTATAAGLAAYARRIGVTPTAVPSERTLLSLASATSYRFFRVDPGVGGS